MALRTMLIEALRRDGQNAEALAEVTEALETDATHPAWWAQRADLEGQQDAAIGLESARKAHALDPSPAHTTLLARPAGRNWRQHRSTRRLGSRCLMPATPAPAWVLAARLAEPDNTDTTLSLLDRGLAEHPDDGRLLSMRVRIRLQSGQSPSHHDLQSLGVQDDVPWHDLANPLAAAGHRLPRASRHHAGLR